jgi:hypothetical protein
MRSVASAAVRAGQLVVQDAPAPAAAGREAKNDQARHGPLAHASQHITLTAAHQRIVFICRLASSLPAAGLLDRRLSTV